MKKYILIILTVLIVCASNYNLRAQQALTLNEAIQLALKNNYSIRIAQNNTRIADINNSAGEAGFLPSVGINGQYTNTNNSYNQKYFDGTENTYNNANGSNLSGSVMLNWTIFDGMRMFIEKKQLSRYEALSNIELKMEIENTVAEVIMIYYNIVQQQQITKVLENTLEFSNRRYVLAKAKFELGTFSELSYLQAFIDLNTDSTAFIKQTNILGNLKAQMNTCLFRAHNTEFMAADTIVIDDKLNINDFVSAIDSGSQYLYVQKQVEIAELSKKLTNAPKYPKLNAFAGYTFSQIHAETGSYKFSQTNGSQFGLSVSYPVFNGFENRRASAKTFIQFENTQLKAQQTQLELKSAIYQMYNDFVSNNRLIRKEEENLKYARKNSLIAFEKYKLGAISDFELRQIQLRELETQNNLLKAQYMAKISETELKRVCSLLIVNY